MPNVVVIGTLDTKGAEYAFLCERIRAHGADVVLVDAGIIGEPSVTADISRNDVAGAVGADVAALAAAGDRGAAIEAMSRGAAAVATRLLNEGRLDAVVGMGGTGGTSLVSYAMQQLPVGVPKLVVSTVASGETRPYVGAVDITMMYSVVDVAGVNQISARIIANAAAAVAGMAGAEAPSLGDMRPLIGASMFGVTTPCVTVGRERLESLSYEVLVFHQTGTGGQSMEELVRAGFIKGVLDVTTTELCDELVGGVLRAHAKRLEVAGSLGVPQVVSLGALDMVNFGPMDTVPAQFRSRTLYVHNPTVTLMRTTPDECAELGRRVAQKLNTATGPTALFVPLRGVSMIATEGQPFYDSKADDALFSSIRETVGPNVEVHEVDTDVNDPDFALAMANRLHAMIGEARS
ncbi:MAG TPA: Tm-1-like ATP-binding domain-containing protein [Nocardioidaceae bacterium]